MDIIDLRDIIGNYESDPETYDMSSSAVMEDFGDTLEWLADNEPTMIPDWDFVEYAQKLADDLGVTNRKDPWPLTRMACAVSETWDDRDGTRTLHNRRENTHGSEEKTTRYRDIFSCYRMST